MLSDTRSFLRNPLTLLTVRNIDLSNKLRKALPGKFHHLLGCL